MRPSATRRSSSTERISEPSCSFWLRFWATSFAVEVARDPAGGAVEEVDGGPQQVVEVGFEAGILQGRDQRVEDVGDGTADGGGLGQRPRIGLVLERTPAVELELGEDVCGRG